VEEREKGEEEEEETKKETKSKRVGVGCSFPSFLFFYFSILLLLLLFQDPKGIQLVIHKILFPFCLSFILFFFRGDLSGCDPVGKTRA